MKRIILFFALSFAALTARSYFYVSSYLTFYYGTAYRFDDPYRHAFSVDKWLATGTCTTSDYKGYGAFFEYRDKSDFMGGIRAYTAATRNCLGPWYLYVGGAVSFFSVDRQPGACISPEIGIHFSPFDDLWGFSANLGYGYDLPVLSAADYTPVRHRLTLKIGLDCFVLWR